MSGRHIVSGMEDDRAEQVAAQIRAEFDKLYRRKWWQRRSFSPAEGRRVRALMDEYDALRPPKP